MIIVSQMYVNVCQICLFHKTLQASVAGKIRVLENEDLLMPQRLETCCTVAYSLKNSYQNQGKGQAKSTAAQAANGKQSLRASISFRVESTSNHIVDVGGT